MLHRFLNRPVLPQENRKSKRRRRRRRRRALQNKSSEAKG